MFCVFGAPNTLPNHAELALQCACDMRTTLAQANADWEHAEPKLWYGQGTAQLHMRIGIHTGVVIAGNVGTRSRAKYSIIGDVVNVAARVEQLNKELDTDALITEETLFRLPEAQRRTAVLRGEHKVKGRDHAVVVNPSLSDVGIAGCKPAAEVHSWLRRYAATPLRRCARTLSAPQARQVPGAL
jgi:adenylate cyclase